MSDAYPNASAAHRAGQDPAEPGERLPHHPPGQAPDGEAPGQDAPGPDAPGRGTPDQDVPGRGTPGPDAPGRGTPGPDAPGRGTPDQGADAARPDPLAADEPAPLGVVRTPTGRPAVDALLERLGDVDHLTADGHLDVYEDVHQGLRAELTALDERPGPRPYDNRS